MEIRQLTDAAEKQAVTRLILKALPEWFGIPEAREAYIRESAGRIFFCAYDRNRPVGFLTAGHIAERLRLRHIGKLPPLLHRRRGPQGGPYD